jgi:hypothetical protein
MKPVFSVHWQKNSCAFLFACLLTFLIGDLYAQKENNRWKLAWNYTIEDKLALGI